MYVLLKNSSLRALSELRSFFPSLMISRWWQKIEYYNQSIASSDVTQNQLSWHVIFKKNEPIELDQMVVFNDNSENIIEWIYQSTLSIIIFPIRKIIYSYLYSLILVIGRIYHLPRSLSRSCEAVAQMSHFLKRREFQVGAGAFY